MENKELEKKLQESADNIKMKEFSAVWAEIDGGAPTRFSEKRRRKRWIAAGVAACLTLVCCVGLIIGLYVWPKETVYFHPGSLGETLMEDLDQFEAELAKVGIFPVDFSRYEVSACALLQTNETLETKGGAVSIGYDLENPVYLADVNFYDRTVAVRENYLNYEHYFTVNSAQIWYDVKEYDETDGYRVYAVTAKYKNLTYVMEYAVFTDDIEEFLTGFFS